MNESKSRRALTMLCMAGAMAALVAVGSKIPDIQIPSPLGSNRFHLGNVMCALSGLLLGPWWGFAAAGLGSFLYDLTQGYYAHEAFITFFVKGVYGLVSGLVMYYGFVRLLKRERDSYPAMLASSLCAALAFLVVYSVKVYFYNGMLIEGFTTPVQCWALIVGKLPATLVNGGLAVICAPVLGVAIRKALKEARLEQKLAM